MKRSAFTMMELMIAMGILAVGMAMSASLFPTAAKEANTAIGSAIGQTIAENGLAMGKLAFRAENHQGVGSVTQVRFTGGDPSGRVDEYASGSGEDTTLLTPTQTRYPMGDDNSKYGFALLARRVSSSADAYQIISTAYRKQDASNKVDWSYVLAVQSGEPTNEVTITSGSRSEGSQAYVNSPLILRDSGKIATVIAQNGAVLTLDRKITIPDRYIYVLRERKSSGGFEDRSPAIYTMTVTTALDD